MSFLQHVFLLPNGMMDMRHNSETRRGAGWLLLEVPALDGHLGSNETPQCENTIIFPRCLVPQPRSPLPLCAEPHS